MTTKPFVLLVAAVLSVAAIGFIAFSPEEQQGTDVSSVAPDGSRFEGPTEPPPSGVVSVPEDGVISEGFVREITVEGGDYFFSPARIEAQPGERLRLTFMNVGRLPHTFDIDELGVHTGTVAVGASKIVEFTASSSSVTYRSYCAIPGHVAQGMAGEIVIR